MHNVFTTFGGGFGDCWAAACFFASRSSSEGRIAISQPDERICAALQVLDFMGRVHVVEANASTAIMTPTDASAFFQSRGYAPQRIVPWRTLFALPYTPTVLRWHRVSKRQVVYQLNSSGNTKTSSSPIEIATFVESLLSLQVEAIPIGLPQTLEEIIQVVSTSGFFVGIDSGMSHLCHSVGIPSVLLRNGLPLGYLQVTHYGKAFHEFANMDAFLISLKDFVRRAFI
jgi:hypothetical protein